ncbi:MAG: helix-turn-helix domain-containing protein [bacterium]|nr:helix-turn-helix domain-containing protein [bacterium]
MAQRISFEERVRIEETARRLGRHHSTVHRELRRSVTFKRGPEWANWPTLAATSIECGARTQRRAQLSRPTPDLPVEYADSHNLYHGGLYTPPAARDI